jgi:serine/threonine-protein kinase HipA
MAEAEALIIRLHGQVVGTLTHLGGDRTIFSFADAFVAQADRPTLSLSFKGETGLLTDIAPTQRRLAPFFANLLPEGPLRTYLAARAGVNAGREFPLLRALGRDLPGAVTATPAGDDHRPGRLATPPPDHGTLAGPALRFSLAGVQLKFSAVRNPGRRGGLTIPARGEGGDWIVKLPSPHFAGVPENEFAMMTLARTVGINVPDIALVAMDQIAGLPEGATTLQAPAFAIRRFDRSAAGPVHVEDFAQVYGVYPERKYTGARLRGIARILAAEAPPESLDEFIRRVTFTVLIGNGDMHLKNWSLIYPDQRRAQLAPAYDFVSTIPYIPGDGLALKAYGARAFGDVTYAEIGALAAWAGASAHGAVQIARQTTARFLDAWQQQKASLPLAAATVASIDAHLARLALVSGD